jgi:hypothetical protein
VWQQGGQWRVFENIAQVTLSLSPTSSLLPHFVILMFVVGIALFKHSAYIMAMQLRGLHYDRIRVPQAS